MLFLPFQILKYNCTSGELESKGLVAIETVAVKIDNVLFVTIE